MYWPPYDGSVIHLSTHYQSLSSSLTKTGFETCRNTLFIPTNQLNFFPRETHKSQYGLQCLLVKARRKKRGKKTKPKNNKVDRACIVEPGQQTQILVNPIRIGASSVMVEQGVSEFQNSEMKSGIQ